jgi:hypothetical protein
VKYFTHNSDASKAVRLRKFVRRFGAEGYGLWWMLVEAAAMDMESCGGWLHPEFDMEELALNAGFDNVEELDPILDMLESLKDEDGLGLIVRGESGRVGIPPLLHHLSEHLAKKQKRTSGDWTPISGVSKANSGATPENGLETPELVGEKGVLKENIGEERKGEEKRDRGALVVGERFAEFWSAYPRKVGKKAALAAWKKAKIGNGLFPQVIQAVKTQAKSEQWQKDNGQYIPNPATWINQGRWDDEAQNLMDEEARKKARGQEIVEYMMAGVRK